MLFVVPLFLMGMSTYIACVIIHYAPAGAILATYSVCSRKLLLKKKAKIDINICLQLQNQDGKITAVAIFPPEITDVFGEETLEEAKGNPVTFIQNISSVYAYVIGPL